MCSWNLQQASWWTGQLVNRPAGEQASWWTGQLVNRPAGEQSRSLWDDGKRLGRIRAKGTRYNSVAAQSSTCFYLPSSTSVDPEQKRLFGRSSCRETPEGRSCTLRGLSSYLDKKKCARKYRSLNNMSYTFAKSLTESWILRFYLHMNMIMNKLIYLL